MADWKPCPEAEEYTTTPPATLAVDEDQSLLVPETPSLHKPSTSSLSAGLSVGEQVIAGVYLVFTDRPMRLVLEKTPAFSWDTAYFCLDPYKTCACVEPGTVRLGDSTVGGGLSLAPSCDSCWRMQDLLVETLVPLNCDINLVHWGPNMKQHATVVGPLLSLSVQHQVQKMLFGPYPWLRKFCHLSSKASNGSSVPNVNRKSN